MKINNTINKAGSTGRVSETGKKRAPAAGAGKRPSTGGQTERVDIGPLAGQLAALESSLENVQVVDSQRVEAIKQAISEGRFRVNADVVADRLLSTVKELVLNHRG